MAPDTPDFRTRPDGTVYPIRNSRGRGGAAALAVGTALAVASAGGGAGVASLGGAGEAAVSAAERAVIRNIQHNLGKAKRTARTGRTGQAWRQLRLRQGRRHVIDNVKCRALSYGQVQDFFTRTPCRGISRVQFPVVDGQGHTASVLVSRVRWSRYSDARAFKRLIDVHGTGDIEPVLPVVRFTGHHYGSDRRGKTVVVAEAESAGTAMSGQLLDEIARTAVVLAPR